MTQDHGPQRLLLAGLIAALVLAVPAVAAQKSRGSRRGQAAPTASPPVRDLTAEDLEGLSFRSVGPANMGGRVAALAWVPGSFTSFYAGFGTGGVFRTENLGVTWSPVFDEQRGLSIGSLAVADAPPDWPGWEEEEKKEAAAGAATDGKPREERGKGRIVWVGTGEGNGRNSSSWGHGVYRSTDGGATFRPLGLDATHDIPALAVDPRDPDVAYVAALGHLWGPNPERGVYRTRDGGKTWDHVLKVDPEAGACDVAIDPASPDTVYAALYARRRTPWSFQGVSDKGGIFRSDDAGKTWTKLAGGLPARTGRIGLAVYPRDPRIVYAAVESDEGGTGRDPFDDRSPSGGLFRSEDRGETWTRVSRFSFRPFYFSRVAMGPENDQRVYLLGWDLAISDDGGRTFRRSGSELVHVDHHAIAINPRDTSRIVLGNDGGVYVSHDRAGTWDFRNNLAVGQFYRIAVDSLDPYRIGGGLQDNGSWIGPSETLLLTEDEKKDGILNEDWQFILDGDGFGVAFDPTDPNVVYATSQGGALVRIHLDTKVRRSLQPAPREGQERFRFNWDAPFVLSVHDPTVLYLGGNRVFRLTERGDRWSAISPDLSRRDVDRIQTVGSEAETYGTVTALAESPLRAGLLWAGTDDGRLHLTRDDGGAWADASPRQAGGHTFTHVAASAHAEGTAYASVSGHRWDVMKPIVLMTDDFGKTWADIAGDLPGDEPVKVVIEDPASRQVLYAGTEFGLYVTLDRGRRWVRMNGKTLPPAVVDDLVLQPRETDLVVGTHGRSIYVLDDASMFAQLTPEVRAKPLALLAMQPARPRLYATRGYGLAHGIFRAKNPPMGAAVNFWVKEAAGEPVSITITDPGGTGIRTLTATSRRGLNRVVWDLQADPKHRFDSPESGFLGQTVFVPEGDYTVTVTMEKEKASGTVKVLAAPNADPLAR
jgi:photosystem II stability/assembly factor-like uncharacterized protein